MNEYLYEITKDIEEEYYTEFLKKHRNTNNTSEGDEDYEVICM